MFDLFRPSRELSGVGFGIMQLFIILYINCSKEAANRVPILVSSENVGGNLVLKDGFIFNCCVK